jgi:glycine hydroxymethyltransferase
MVIKSDPKMASLIDAEIKRQKEGIELIPSENYVSKAVLAASGSVFTNKYSEGYPGKRYYGGNRVVDSVEELAIARAKKLFNTNYHVNVQPYSGSPANTAVYLGLLNFGDKIMGMRLDQGGHLTHGSPVSFSGKAYKIVSYGVNSKTERLDYDEILKLAQKERPKLIVCGATAYPRQIDFKRFAMIAKKVGAILMADISHIAGLVAARAHPSPFGYADVITTTTHKTLRGPRSAIIFCKAKYARDIDKAVFPGLQGGPHDHTTAAKAVCFAEDARPSFRVYAKQIIKNARALASALEGLGYRIVSGGTDNHLLLVDVSKKGLTGKAAQDKLDAVGISVNKNTIPYDPLPPKVTSGVRLGTPAVTSRGMKEKDMQVIASLIDEALTGKVTASALSKKVVQFSKKFELPGIDN